MAEKKKRVKREMGVDESGNPLKSVNDYKSIIEEANKKMELAKEDEKKKVVVKIREQIVEYNITIGSLRGEPTDVLMKGTKNWIKVEKDK